MVAELDTDRLVEGAREQTGLQDMGDLPYREPLEVLVDSLNGEAGLDPSRLAVAGSTITGLLVKRLRLVDDRRRNPEIGRETIESPIFIVGLPRTGSTHLHALLGQVSGTRVPLYWEMAMPSPPPTADTYETDPRIAQVRAALDQLPAEMLVRHPMAADRPEQCNLLNDWSLVHQALLAYYDIPSYRAWLLGTDYAVAFEAHRRMLQHLQWQVPGQWVLKYPKHLIALDSLFATYPDARVVWTHRDPAVVVPSVASFTGYIRASTSGPIDEVKYGRDWAVFEELVLLRGMAVRERIGIDDPRFLDVHYHELESDPVVTVGRIAEYFDLPFDGRSEAAVAKFAAGNPRTKHGAHKYSAAQFGLDPDGLRRRFAPYIERYGVRTEAAR